MAFDAEKSFQLLLNTIAAAHASRPQALRQKDWKKMQKDAWFTSNELAGMSLYVDRFAGDLKGMNDKLSYLQKLGSPI